MTGLFDRLKDEDSEGSEMVEERPSYEEPETTESLPDNEPSPSFNEAQESVEQTSSRSDIGISSLMDKRAKLEEAIDYVGMMISNLKEKRTGLEKEIEEESVDIKNLK